MWVWDSAFLTSHQVRLMLVRQGPIEQRVFRPCCACDGQGVWKGTGDLCTWSHLPRSGEKIRRVTALPKARQVCSLKRPITVTPLLLMEWCLYVDPDVQCPRQEQRRRKSWCLSLNFSRCFQRGYLTKIKNTHHHQFKKLNKHTKLPWTVNHKWFTNARDHQGNWGGCLWVTFEKV